MKRLALVFFIFCFILNSIAQEIPPVQSFDIVDYAAGNQNWSVTQGEDKHLYFGNNSGLLEFDGAVWNLYPSNNGSIIRAVYHKDGLIYSGCYMEFGFWERNQLGRLIYTSLLDKLPEPLIEDEHFWNITSRDEWIIFQSLDRLYIFNTEDESFKIVDFEIPRAKIFNLKEKLFVQKGNGGLYSIQNGKLILESDHPVFKENFIVGIYDYQGRILILTEKGKFYFLENEAIIEWKVESWTKKKDLLLYTSIRLKDGSFILGTISDGYIRLSNGGELLESINQENGLGNSTVLSAFQDEEDNLWLGMDIGISVVNLESEFSIYTDTKGELGSVYTSLEHNGLLYLGSNQGLFVKKMGKNEKFEPIAGTSGQVWNLKSINGIVFCSHTKGTFIVDGNQATSVFDGSGTWEVKMLPGRDDLLLQGNYDGLSVLEFREDKWVFKNMIDGFDISSKSFVLTEDQDIIVNHEFKGIHMLELNEDLSAIVKQKVIKPIGFDSNIFNYKDEILYACNEGAFKFDPIDGVLTRDSLFNDLFYGEGDAIYGKLIHESGNNRLWGFSENNIIYVTPDSFDGSPKKLKLSIPSFFRRNQAVIGYENISTLTNGTYVLGTLNGYAVIDLAKTREKQYEIKITSFEEKFLNEDNQQLDFNQPLAFNFDHNNLICNYSIPNYDKFKDISYQYELKGLNKGWSKWYSEPYLSLENLPYGNYQLKIRGRVGNTLTNNMASLSFEIRRPWYLSIFALVLYAVIFITAMIIINRMYVRHYRKQRAKLIEDNKKKVELAQLEGQQEVMRLRNERLRSELESKNRELATTAMSLINKNELLQGIKKDILQLDDAASRKEVARVIDKNLSNNSDWEFFKEAFDNADQDFLSKIKKLHPNLTANDLKFCAFLRLNLSSKEIAPLLNISVRSVEIKRYRLRKKLQLEHSENLINYILEV